MVIQVDSREKRHIIQRILDGFDRRGVQHYTSKLYKGDYMSLDNPRLVVDRKQNLAEVAYNFTDARKTTKGYGSRFEQEMIDAKKMGIKIVFLVEHGGPIKTIEDVAKWVNPRLQESPMAISGERIYRKMLAFQNYYGVEFQFCSKAQTADRIIEILQGGEEHGLH
ncbi:MAG: ERCC4 domain-containing protein [Firmicutes bacterium]|nr:ERCC4 domain-containing protein [Bacillota bacterium]